MKKIIGAVLVMALVTTAATAQSNKNVKLSLGAEIGAPTGNLNTLYSLGIGGTLQADFMIDTDAAITLNTGVIQYVGRKIEGSNLKYRSVALIPLLAGVKYYFSPDVYGSAQLGATVNTARGGGSSFTYIPGIGYKFDDQFDVLFKYTGYSNNNRSGGGAVGVRLGYTF